MPREEWFDVVNDCDEVIGRELRATVHAKNLHHRAIHILLSNSKQEIFLQKRSAKKDLHPNVWDSSCSGHLDSGEDYDTAANREIGEELGLQPAPKLNHQIKLSPCHETGWEFVAVYLTQHEGPFELDPEEISEGRFFSKSEITAWISQSPEDFAPAFIYLWQILGLAPE
jgi:isopentenyldiphosphate isomerase